MNDCLGAWTRIAEIKPKILAKLLSRVFIAGKDSAGAVIKHLDIFGDGLSIGKTAWLTTCSAIGPWKTFFDLVGLL